MSPALEQELKTYAEKLPELQRDTGKFVLIKGNQVVDIYDSYADALKEGYEKFGLDPFLVKEIATTERIFQFTRHIASACH